MIDFGFVIGTFVPLVLFWIFGDKHLRAVWRLSLGLGVVPALIVFVWRLRMANPTRFQKDNMLRVRRIPYWLIFKRYWKGLTALCLAWFIYDFITYPFGIYSSIVVDNITGSNTSLTVSLGWATVINLFYMPGTLGGAFIVDYIGPKNCMLLGLISQAIIGFIMSGAYNSLQKHIGAFAVVYGIFLSLGEVGPGNCLGMLAAKSGPTAVRGQYYGIAAAVGKIGAFVGTWVFPIIIKNFGGSDTNKGNTGPFWIGSGLAVLSAIITFFFIRPLSADSMKKEDAEFRLYLEAHGFDTSLMGSGDIADDQESVSSDEEKTQYAANKVDA